MLTDAMQSLSLAPATRQVVVEIAAKSRCVELNVGDDPYMVASQVSESLGGHALRLLSAGGKGLSPSWR